MDIDTFIFSRFLISFRCFSSVDSFDDTSLFSPFYDVVACSLIEPCF